MRIAVCIKQVPDTTSVRIDPVTNTLMREGVASVANPFDLLALEQALMLKEARAAEVTVFSMGPPQAEDVLDRGLCAVCAEKYDSPCTRFCPAEVYRREAGSLTLDFSNCLHCKTCSDKCPYDNIGWTFPEAGGGPCYS